MGNDPFNIGHRNAAIADDLNAFPGPQAFARLEPPSDEALAALGRQARKTQEAYEQNRSDRNKRNRDIAKNAFETAYSKAVQGLTSKPLTAPPDPGSGRPPGSNPAQADAARPESAPSRATSREPSERSKLLIEAVQLLHDSERSARDIARCREIINELRRWPPESMSETMRSAVKTIIEDFNTFIKNAKGREGEETAATAGAAVTTEAREQAQNGLDGAIMNLKLARGRPHTADDLDVINATLAKANTANEGLAMHPNDPATVAAVERLNRQISELLDFQELRLGQRRAKLARSIREIVEMARRALAGGEFQAKELQTILESCENLSGRTSHIPFRTETMPVMQNISNTLYSLIVSLENLQTRLSDEQKRQVTEDIVILKRFKMGIDGVRRSN